MSAGADPAEASPMISAVATTPTGERRFFRLNPHAGDGACVAPRDRLDVGRRGGDA
jgi:hypothetical protein